MSMYCYKYMIMHAIATLSHDCDIKHTCNMLHNIYIFSSFHKTKVKKVIPELCSILMKLPQLCNLT